MTPKATSHVIPLTGKKVWCNGAWWKLFLNIPLYIVTFTTTYINTIEQKDLCNGLTRFACREPEEGVQIWTQFILGVAFKTRQGRRPDILKIAITYFHTSQCNDLIDVIDINLKYICDPKFKCIKTLHLIIVFMYVNTNYEFEV